MCKGPMITQTLSDGTSYSLRASREVTLTESLKSTVLRFILLPIAVPSYALWAMAMATPLRNKLLKWMIPLAMDHVEKRFSSERRTLLRGIHGTVLDVGSGGGAYLRYCHTKNDAAAAQQGLGAVKRYVAVEPLTEHHPRIRAAASEANMTRQLTIVKDLQDLLNDPSSWESSFDWVILGNVLCEVPDVRSTIETVDRLLKPGGMVYFSEHVARPREDWRRTFQEIVNPLWRHLGGGCNCNRESIMILKQAAPTWEVIHWTYEDVQVGMGPFQLGLARKH